MVKTTVLSILRSILAVAVGALTVLIVLFGTILLLVPGWMAEGSFPDTTPGLALLLGLEVLAGVAGAFIAALLAPRAFVPVQTWVGIVLALRVRARRGRPELSVEEGS